MQAIPSPENITDLVLKKLTFAYDAERRSNEFELKKWLLQLKDKKEKDVFTDKDYAAYGLVLFNLAQYAGFVAVMEEARKVYGENNFLIACDIVGKHILVYSAGVTIPDFDMYKEWFERESGRKDKPLLFQHGFFTTVFLGKKFRLKNAVEMEVALSAEKVFTFSYYDFIFTRPYEWMKATKFDIGSAFFYEITDRLRRGTLKSEEKELLKFVLSLEDYNYFMETIDYEAPGDVDFPETKEEIEALEEFSTFDEMIASLK